MSRSSGRRNTSGYWNPRWLTSAVTDVPVPLLGLVFLWRGGAEEDPPVSVPLASGGLTKKLEPPPGPDESLGSDVVVGKANVLDVPRVDEVVVGVDGSVVVVDVGIVKLEPIAEHLRTPAIVGVTAKGAFGSAAF
jgi:hypothetical protein